MQSLHEQVVDYNFFCYDSSLIILPVCEDYIYWCAWIRWKYCYLSKWVCHLFLPWNNIFSLLSLLSKVYSTLKKSYSAFYCGCLLTHSQYSWMLAIPLSLGYGYSRSCICIYFVLIDEMYCVSYMDMVHRFWKRS
jgi:hypothetical protein